MAIKKGKGVIMDLSTHIRELFSKVEVLTVTQVEMFLYKLIDSHTTLIKQRIMAAVKSRELFLLDAAGQEINTFLYQSMNEGVYLSRRYNIQITPDIQKRMDLFWVVIEFMPQAKVFAWLPDPFPLTFQFSGQINGKPADALVRVAYFDNGKEYLRSEYIRTVYQEMTQEELNLKKNNFIFIGMLENPQNIDSIKQIGFEYFCYIKPPEATEDGCSPLQVFKQIPKEDAWLDIS